MHVLSATILLSVGLLILSLGITFPIPPTSEPSIVMGIGGVTAVVSLIWLIKELAEVKRK